MIDNKPAWLNFDEGRVIMNGSSVYFTETHLKDHLGNTRVAIGRSNNALVVKQVNSYYPFGMNIKGLTTSNNMPATKAYQANEYLYNGKMFQDELGLDWLDYGARFYDAVLGRWHVVDPLSEQRSWTSPYIYAQNNPIVRIDPDGMLDTDFGVKKDGTIVQISPTDDKPDRLYAVNNDKTKKDISGDGKVGVGDYETINDKSILPSLTTSDPEMTENLQSGKQSWDYKSETWKSKYDQKQLHYGLSSVKSEAKKVFSFAASNSDVEWSLSGNKYGGWAVGTINESAIAPSFTGVAGFNKENKIYGAHSHSGNSSRVDFQPSGNDILNAHSHKQINPNYKSYLFMPKNPNGKWMEIR